MIRHKMLMLESCVVSNSGKRNDSYPLDAFMHTLVRLFWFDFKEKDMEFDKAEKKNLETFFPLFYYYYFFYKTLLMAWRPCNASPTYNKKERERKKLKSFTLIRSHHQTGQKYDNIWYVILSFLTVICSFEIEVQRDIEPVWSKIFKILLGRLFKSFSFWCYFRN